MILPSGISCFAFCSIPLLCISTSFFFSCLDLMGIILRVFQRISLHQNWRWTFTLSYLLLKQGLAAKTRQVCADTGSYFAALAVT